MILPTPIVLIAEDEPVVALFLEDLLLELGCRVVVTTGLAQAVQAARSETIDVAILDINLNGEQSYPAAAALLARGIPFGFASGYGPEGRDPSFADVPVLAKPYRESQVDQLLRQLLPSLRG
ncbi:response regulator [Geminicoccus roseus]|uniref:response regulator n=1 Tax=Geminicoccus roseus TaxID=404900 RepID=UPI00040DB385|nr:response regulator [Geminicoccus roseus]